MSKSSTAPDAIYAQAGVADHQTVSASPLAGKAPVSKDSRTRRRTVSPKASPSEKQRHATGPGTKQDLVLQMLRRQAGVSTDDIASKTDWQPHSVRGFLSAVARKKLKLPLVSEVGKDGLRRYRVAPPKPTKA